MADHPRKQIRAALVALLKAPVDPEAATLAYHTAAGPQWYDSRDIPLDVERLPAGLIYTPEEQIDPAYLHQGGNRRRILTLRAEIYTTGDDAPIDVDEIAWQVEEFVRLNATVGNRVEWCNLKSTNIGIAGQGEMTLFVAVLEFEVIYWTEVVEVGGRPTTVLLGFDPETGPGNEGDYTVVTGDDDA